jgi:hypothetical protein
MSRFSGEKQNIPEKRYNSPEEKPNSPEKLFCYPEKNKVSRRNESIRRGKTKFTGEMIQFPGEK